MLQRATQVGEFYRMHPPPVWDVIHKLPASYADLLIYNEEDDRHQHIRFETALKASITLPDEEGKDNDMLVKLLTGESTSTGASRKAREDVKKYHSVAASTLSEEEVGEVQEQIQLAEARFNAAEQVETENPQDFAERKVALKKLVDQLKARLNGSGSAFKDDAGSMAAALKALTDDNGFTVKNYIACVKAGIWLPFCIVIARPFIEHLMLSSIMTVSGRDTGATLFGPADMQISANTSIKTIEGHYTCHTKSVITKPQNVLVMRDIMCSGYVAGANCVFFGMNKVGEWKATAEEEIIAHIETDINDRLSQVEVESATYASMFAFLCPYNEVEQAGRDQVISVSERLLPWEVTRHAGGEKKGFPGGKLGFDTYKDKFHLDQLHFGEDVRAVENAEFISQGSVNNATCFIGPHRRFNPFSASFFELVPGQGHFGPDAIPGDARWRRGESVSLEAARNSMVSLEVAAQSQLALRPRSDKGI
jgi:hypothetical protein